MSNVILSTDSYKLTHWKQYPPNTNRVYSYMEAREGGRYPYTVFFGLQAIIKEHLEGRVVTWDGLEEAVDIAAKHLGVGSFNYKGWAKIIDKHKGKLPVEIRAVLEGTPVPLGNVMMTIENTDPEFPWLTNALESILMHVWYPSTVATLSRHTKQVIEKYLDKTAMSTAGLPFMLHDFGFRGASSEETAAIGGAAHLLNFQGTDTLPAIVEAKRYYGADLSTLAFSVPATEHSVMTARGVTGEYLVLDQLLASYPEGILSVVADSYDIYQFVKNVAGPYRDQIKERDGKFVVRPDSITQQHPTPESLVVWILETLWRGFSGTVNVKGNKILDSHVGVLWGDGLEPDEIERILAAMELHGFSAENIVFGMGGGLLQKVNRDTQRFAIKASAIEIDGKWTEIRKDPRDSTKKSKAGKLALVYFDDKVQTVPYTGDGMGVIDGHYCDDMLQTVFKDGEIVVDQTFEEIRKRAAL